MEDTSQSCLSTRSIFGHKVENGENITKVRVLLEALKNFKISVHVPLLLKNWCSINICLNSIFSNKWIVLAINVKTTFTFDLHEKPLFIRYGNSKNVRTDQLVFASKGCTHKTWCKCKFCWSMHFLFEEKQLPHWNIS